MAAGDPGFLSAVAKVTKRFEELEVSADKRLAAFIRNQIVEALNG